jgi:hypothetical protein
MQEQTGRLTVCAGTTPSDSELFAQLTGADVGGTLTNTVISFTPSYTKCYFLVQELDTATVTVTEQAHQMQNRRNTTVQEQLKRL